MHAETPNGDDGGSVGLTRRVNVHALHAVADADAIGCAIQAADDILSMYTLLKSSARPPFRPPSARVQVAGEGDTCEDGQQGDDNVHGASGAGAEFLKKTASNTTTPLCGVSSLPGGTQQQQDVQHVTRHPLPLPPDSVSVPSATNFVLCVELTDGCNVSMPLSADREISVEVDSATAEFGAVHGEGRASRLHAQAASLTMKGMFAAVEKFPLLPFSWVF